MKSLLRVVACLFLCVSLNSFGVVSSGPVDSKRFQFDSGSYLIPNPDYAGPYGFFDIDAVPEFLSVEYIEDFPNAYGFTTNIQSDIYSDNGVNLIDVSSHGYLDTTSTWGWNDQAAALRINTCENEPVNYDWCSSLHFYAPGLNNATILINNEETFYAFFEYSHSGKFFDLMVGEPIDRYSFWNNYYGYITPEEYSASQVPLPAGIYLFLSGLVGLGLMRGGNA